MSSPTRTHNQELALLFTAIAGLLSSRGANPYRVRAYRRAAEAMLNLSEDIRAIAERGELRTISGIGKELASKIEEFLRYGRIGTYEELKVPLPPDVKAWVHLPGFSEPLVHDLFYRLGMTTLDDLERLVRSRLLQTVPGTTLQMEEVLEGIQALRVRIGKGAGLADPCG